MEAKKALRGEPEVLMPSEDDREVKSNELSMYVLSLTSTTINDDDYERKG